MWHFILKPNAVHSVSEVISLTEVREEDSLSVRVMRPVLQTHKHLKMRVNIDVIHAYQTCASTENRKLRPSAHHPHRGTLGNAVQKHRSNKCTYSWWACRLNALGPDDDADAGARTLGAPLWEAGLVRCVMSVMWEDASHVEDTERKWARSERERVNQYENRTTQHHSPRHFISCCHRDTKWLCVICQSGNLFLKYCSCTQIKRHSSSSFIQHHINMFICPHADNIQSSQSTSLAGILF